jgi:predicted nucleic acid-binding Zn ribbon protein
MDSTVAVLTKGLGFWFQDRRKASVADSRSATLRKTPRRMALSSR